MKIIELLNIAKLKMIENNIKDANIQAKTLMKYILNQKENYIIANMYEDVETEMQNDFLNAVDKVISGMPIQYITNKQEFMKLDFYVDENVLIPQPDTEIIVENVINYCTLNKNRETIEILDICTGSGAIGISLAKYINNSKIYATDISNKALQIAKLNAEKNLVHKKMEFILSNMFENLANKYFDIIVSNPPYIKTEEIKSLDKDVQNEPVLALDGGKDGLLFYKIIAENAFKYLNKNGRLYIEIGYNQKEDVTNILKQTEQYTNIDCVQDLAKNDRVIYCNKKG